MLSCDTNILFAAASKAFARRRIHDVRLAETLKYWGVDEFYTRNVRDFEDLGFHILSTRWTDCLTRTSLRTARVSDTSSAPSA